jgi:hypothetical protein
MEALAAFGVASNVIQFVNFTSKVVTGTAKVYRARPSKKALADSHDQDSSLVGPDSMVFLGQRTAGFEKHNKNLTKALCLQAPRKVLRDNDEEIIRLCEDCAGQTRALLSALERLKCTKISIWSSFVAALKTIWN